jgi:hypothetical protein
MRGSAKKHSKFNVCNSSANAQFYQLGVCFLQILQKIGIFAGKCCTNIVQK